MSVSKIEVLSSNLSAPVYFSPPKATKKDVISSPLTSLFLTRKASRIGMAVVLKTAALFTRIEVRVFCFPSIFLRLCSSTELERKFTNLEVVSSNLTKVFLFRVRLIGRTHCFGQWKIGSNPLPEVSFFLTGCSADGYTGFFWKEVFAGSNPATQIFFLRRRSPIGRGDCLRNKRLWVRISPSAIGF